ncbi:MAG: tetratricopeptide repeat protein [Leptolyngbya sp.]|nr:tetratricopeptide repeat protein [Candidatus Melainabacteria bacterium]
MTVGLILLTTVNLKKFLPTKEKTIITSKRIYASYVMPNGIVRDMEMKSSEYKNIQALYPYTDNSGQFIRVIMNPRQLQLEDLPQNAHSDIEGYDRKYRVKNATVAYSFIPDDVKFSIGERSKSVIKHKGKRRFEAVFGVLFMCLFAGAIALFSICFYAQEHSNDLLRSGRKAYARKQYDVAEATLKRAYLSVAYFPFMHQYGIASYRYALALEANGKLDEAIPKFEQAVQACNWYDDDESNIDWRPAVFRSNVHLAEIYNRRDNKTFAGKYFEAALDTVSKETDVVRAKKFISEYATYLRQRNEVAKAEKVAARGQSFTIPHSRLNTFREDTL